MVMDNQIDNYIMNEFGIISKRLRQLREISGIPQAIVSKECHISQPNYVEYEAGNRKIPLTAIIKVCAFYKITLSQFFDYDIIPLSEDK